MALAAARAFPFALSAAVVVPLALMALGGLVLLFTTLALPKALLPGKGLGPALRGRPAAALTGAALAMVGVYLLLGQVVDLTSSAGLPRNPIPPSAQSRALGKEIYVRECLSCHGPEGLGDGPLAQRYQPGLDLTPHVLAHPSGQLFLWVTYGLGADMPSFEDQLSEEERWHLVNYIRTLGRSSFFGLHVH